MKFRYFGKLSRVLSIIQFLFFRILDSEQNEINFGYGPTVKNSVLLSYYYRHNFNYFFEDKSHVYILLHMILDSTASGGTKHLIIVEVMGAFFEIGISKNSLIFNR